MPNIRPPDLNESRKPDEKVYTNLQLSRLFRFFGSLYEHRMKFIRNMILACSAFVLLWVGISWYSQNAIIRDRCQENNLRDQKQKALWLFVINLSKNSPTLQTPAQREQQVKQFTSYLDNLYKPRTC